MSKPSRKKPLRRYGRRYWPLASKMASMGLAKEFGHLHPRKGWRPVTKYERFIFDPNQE